MYQVRVQSWPGWPWWVWQKYRWYWVAKIMAAAYRWNDPWSSVCVIKE